MLINSVVHDSCSTTDLQLRYHYLCMTEKC